MGTDVKTFRSIRVDFVVAAVSLRNPEQVEHRAREQLLMTTLPILGVNAHLQCFAFV